MMNCETNSGTVCETVIVSTGLATSSLVTTIESVFTTTQQISTTCQVTPGGTVTISPPATPWFIDPSATTAAPSVATVATVPVTTTLAQPIPTTVTVLTTSTISASIATQTVIEIILYLQGLDDKIYSTSTITLPVETATLSTYIQPTPFPVVVARGGDGWNSWSDGQKGGLIAGCVIVLLMLLFLLFCICGRVKGRHVWVANDWSVNSAPQYGTYGPGNLVIRGGAGHSCAEEQPSIDCVAPPPTYHEVMVSKAAVRRDALRGSCGQRPRFYQPPNQPF